MPALVHNAQSVPKPRRVGARYRLDELLARGGMASVFRGHDEQLDRAVAIKLMRNELGEDPNVLRRFETEALRAASVTDAHVVAVYDVGSEDGTAYIVMELIEGGDLAAALTRERPMDPRRAARIGADVADALAAAHRAGVVHRDVKPGNILLDSDGRARVADFGIARATGDESLTRTGAVLGSVDYLSPEQARGERATAASDIYALGVVLYELVTGERPFRGETPYAVATARLRRPPPDPRRADPTVPDELGAIIQRAMSVAPSGRFGSAAELRDALVGWLEPSAADERPPATPPAIEERRRRPLMPWLAAAGVLLLVVAGYLGMRMLADPTEDAVGDPFGVIVGQPGGAVISPTPTPDLTPSPDDATPAPSPTPTTQPETPEPATPVPPTPVPATPVPAEPPAATEAPAVAADSPREAVVTFYQSVASGDFDAAYALWSEGMKAAYPRQGNLDDRFDETAAITFSALDVFNQSETEATVQANFTETYDSGESQDFVGYWRLVAVDGRWLLNEPTY